MVAQQMAQDRPSIFRRMILVGTAPRGGEDIMHLEKPSLAKHLQDPTEPRLRCLKKIFFAPTTASQAAGEAFIARLMQRKDDLDPPSGPNVAKAQIAAFREWERFTGERFADLRGHPSSHAGRAGLPRRDDSGAQLVLAGREPAERRLAGVPGRGARLSFPVSGVLHETRGGIPVLRLRVGRAVSATPFLYLGAEDGQS